MKAWKVILAACVIFTAGVVTGGLAVKLNVRPPPHPTKSNQGTWSSRPRGDVVDRMQRELDLTPAQRTQIEQILRESRERTKQLWESIAPRAQAEHRKVCDDIREILTTDQRPKYDEVFKSGNLFRSSGDLRKRGQSVPSGLGSKPQAPAGSPGR